MVIAAVFYMVYKLYYQKSTQPKVIYENTHFNYIRVKYARKYCYIDIHHIIITTSVSGIFKMILLLLFNTGNRLIGFREQSFFSIAVIRKCQRYMSIKQLVGSRSCVLLLFRTTAAIPESACRTGFRSWAFVGA